MKSTLIGRTEQHLRDLAQSTTVGDNYLVGYIEVGSDKDFNAGFRDGQIELAREVIMAGIISEPIEDLAPTPVAIEVAPVQDETYWMRRCAHAEARLAALETFIAQMADK